MGVMFIGLSHMRAAAFTGADWNPGQIIEDTYFYNNNSMSVADIQNFLNSKVPTCDTQGTQSAADLGYPNMTHAQYAAMMGWPGPPYVCLKDYMQVPQSSSIVDNFSGSTPSGAISAAQIIKNAADTYNISPKAILVTLQKESINLIFDSWPLASQYTNAMGYGCPDSAPCNPTYAGFYNQVTNAAWQFNQYRINPGSYRYLPFQANTIYYNPSDTTNPTPSASVCGASSIFIQDYATAGLYNYTPYQPDQAALNNMPNTGDSCSSYGNLNFWSYWYKWFGDPNYTPPTCDAQVTGTACVWQLQGASDSNFLTSNNVERDNAVYDSQYAYEGTPFYVYTSQEPGTVPVYRLKLTNEHYYTISATERDTLLQNSQNVYEGIAFYVYPPNAASNASYPVSKLTNSAGDVFVADPAEKARLIAAGYTDNGVVFNAPSAFATEPDPQAGNVNIYRLSNSGKHFYTQNIYERDSLIKAGWAYEGIMLEAPATSTATTTSSTTAQTTPIFRLLSPTGDHVFTASSSEQSQLLANGWTSEGTAWYIDSSTPQTYRFYINGYHFYTTSLSEALHLTNTPGVHYEGIAFGYNQGSTLPVYRLLGNSTHFYTADMNEVLSLNNSAGWSTEGVAFNVSTAPTNTPVYRLYDGSSDHFYTVSTAERDQMVSSGWKYEGIAWYASDTVTSEPVYRLYDGSSDHFYTVSTAERDQMVASGWKYEGIAWYAQP